MLNKNTNHLEDVKKTDKVHANERIVGSFRTEEEASRAIEQLKAKGYSTDEISVIAKDRKDMKAISEETGTKAPEGVATGATAGGLVGGIAGLLAGLGIMAIPVFGPIMVAGPIAVTLTGTAVGAGAGGLVGGLIGLGIPEEDAKEYESNVKEGQILVLVEDKADTRTSVHDIFRNNNATNAHLFNDKQVRNSSVTSTPNTAAANADRRTATDLDRKVTPENVGNGRFDSGEDEKTMRLREEQLDVSKNKAKVGEVEVHKEVVEEQKTIDVPVSHEEVVIERRAVHDNTTNEPIGKDESIRIPVSEEQVEVNKRNVVTGEVEVHKETVQNTEQVKDTVKREEARISREGEPAVNADADKTLGREGLNRGTVNDNTINRPRR
ncbi:YsnF/AvaK domain-containing protein [Paenibacillus gallinarum]|uniref:YsnF/AvaK domain-containing protein n=1 Tax=Paenibacillus gallinarum TaxID=2762232 RepID=A0ABR8STB9_9BACL|nr:YsnF/AvaK domain-containing protein [Paenibacillus gallinarum]MBD7966737.1 YsnF/AvaK domain-containing protein [Paenibacillus gallinarum]